MLAGMPAGQPTSPSRRQQSRRRQFSAATRRTLVDEAAQLFASRGYAGTSLDEIVSRAAVTKGALYHHFAGKQDIFRAVFVRTEEEAMTSIRDQVAAESDAWERARAGIRGFLDACQQPAYRRIVLQEGPVALGIEHWRKSEQRTTFGLLRGVVADLLADYDLDDALVDSFAQVFFGALSAAGQAVATAADTEDTGDRIGTVLAVILAGLRALADGDADVAWSQAGVSR